ncbi:MAG: hypothetical protein KDA75_20545 [Planctomycetaceae bacterium]|nr:hypothetical protein [Planctomycetaceae bacterium]
MSHDLRLDRSALSVVELGQADHDLEYWLRQSPEERWRGIELMRQLLYGYSNPPPRLQRILEIVDRPPR